MPPVSRHPCAQASRDRRHADEGGRVKTGMTDALTGWLTRAEPAAKRALLAASMGWMLDAFDVMLYAMVLPALIAAMGMTMATAGLLGSSTLIASAVGGILFGPVRRPPGPQAGVDDQCPDVLGLHGRMRPGALGRSARRLSYASRIRHGWRVDQRRRTRIRDLARRAPRQGDGPDAELMGHRLRRRSDRRRGRDAPVWLARGVLRRHPAGTLHIVDSTPRRGAGNLAALEARGGDSTRRHEPGSLLHTGHQVSNADRGTHPHERLHDVWMVGAQPLDPRLSVPARRPGWGWAIAAGHGRVRRRDAGGHVVRVRHIRLHGGQLRSEARLSHLPSGGWGAVAHLRGRPRAGRAAAARAVRGILRYPDTSADSGPLLPRSIPQPSEPRPKGSPTTSVAS